MAASNAAAPPFPDCWIAYGATDAELRAYGVAPRLMTRPTWAVFAGQVAVLIVLGLVVFSGGPVWLRGIAGGAGVAGGGAAGGGGGGGRAGGAARPPRGGRRPGRPGRGGG